VEYEDGTFLIAHRNGYTNGRTTIVPVAENSVVIVNKVGLHARPASLLVQTAAKFQSRIQVQCGDKTANAKSIVGVMKLGAVLGHILTLHAEGEDAEEALRTLTELVQRKFDEEE
jgi:phosphotransferase system HPr (HPr) family protein